SSAKRAVISEPERLAASTTTMPAHSPEMSRLRRGEKRGRGAWADGVFEAKAPCGRGGAGGGGGVGGWVEGGAAPGPARGGGAGGRPRAGRETTAKPAARRSRASRSAKRRPAAEALRAPTTATAGRCSTAVWPRTARSGGASSIICNRGG